MKPDLDKLYELIEAWLDGDLPPAEAAAFAARVEAEEDLRFRVEQHRLAREVIGDWVAEDYKAKIKTWQQELTDSPPPRKAISKGWWVIVLGFLLIVVGGFWFFTERNDELPNPEQAPTIKPSEPVAGQEDTLSGGNERQEKLSPPDQPVEKSPKEKKSQDFVQKQTPAAAIPVAELIALADKELKEYEISLNKSYESRGEDEPYFKAGKDAFSNKDFKIAREKLELVPETSLNYTAALQLLAYAAFKEKDYAKAAAYYEQFAPRKIGQSTDWWLVQFYLADYAGHKEKFWERLNKILNAKAHTFKRQAQHLKETLERKEIREK